MSWNISLEPGADIDTSQDPRLPIELLKKRLKGLRPAARALGIDHGNLAKMLERSRPIPNEISQRALDLDYVIEKALHVLVGRSVVDWLTGHSIAFGGARPVDVLAAEGPAPLIAELSRKASGGYA